MTTTYRGTHRMIAVISKEELAFLNMYPPQIKLGLIGFTAGFKKNNQAFEKFLKPLSTYMQCWNQTHFITQCRAAISLKY